jgi:hypothetical protein
VDVDIDAGELLDARLEETSNHVLVPSMDAADGDELDSDGVFGIDGMGNIDPDTDGVLGVDLAGMLMSSSDGGNMS